MYGIIFVDDFLQIVPVSKKLKILSWTYKSFKMKKLGLLKYVQDISGKKALEMTLLY